MVKKVQIDLYILTIFFGCGLLIHLLSTIFVSYSLNFFSFLVFVFFIFYLVSRFFRFFPISLYIFGFALSIISSFFIEHYGLYLFEIQEYAHLNGSTTRVIGLILLFITTACLSMIFIDVRELRVYRLKRLDGLVANAMFVIFLVALFFFILISIVYGTPYTYGVDRFTYWRNFVPSGVDKLRYFLIILSSVLGYLFYNKKISSLFFFVLLVLLMISMLLQGEKFSGFVLIAYFLLISQSVSWTNVDLKKPFLYALMAFFILVLITLVNYYFIQGDFSSALDLFLLRISVQGQMNYAIFNLPKPVNGFDDLCRFFAGLDNPDEYSKGIYYFMGLIAPPDVVNRRIEQGTTFTVPFPENFDYFFGVVITPFLIVVLGAFVGLICAFFVSSVKGKSFINSFVLLLVYYYVYGAIMMGNIHKLVEFKFFVMLLVCFVLSVLRSTNEIKRND